jgi:hypothetical protein
MGTGVVGLMKTHYLMTKNKEHITILLSNMVM